MNEAQAAIEDITDLQLECYSEVLDVLEHEYNAQYLYEDDEGREIYMFSDYSNVLIDYSNNTLQEI